MAGPSSTTLRADRWRSASSWPSTYRNPWLSPFDEFQRYKTHPKIRPFFDGGQRVAYGARAVNEGGMQALPKLVFPGGALIGCEAGFLNVPRIKGSHGAMKTGMLAAEAAFRRLSEGSEGGDELAAYPEAFRASWLHDELHRRAMSRPAFRWGLAAGMLHAGVDQMLLRGRAPWTLRHHGADHAATGRREDYAPVEYPRPDGVVSFDKPSSVYLSGTNHEEDQPVHLVLKDAEIPIRVNLAEFDAPEQRYCPAGVYEIVEDAGHAAPPDQCAELRPLQNLRHQGSDPEHRLDSAGRRRRSQLSEYVRPAGCALSFWHSRSCCRPLAGPTPRRR